MIKTNWVKEALSKGGKLSSKRITLISLLVWILANGTFYIVKIQFGGVESLSTKDLLIAALYSAVTLAVGGTAAEALNKNKKVNE